MIPWRLVLAFLTAPAIAPAIVLLGYVVELIVAGPIHLLMQRMGWSGYRHFAAAGLLIGLAMGLLLGWENAKPGAQLLSLLGLCSAFSVAAALAFRFISGWAPGTPVPSGRSSPAEEPWTP